MNFGMILKFVGSTFS